VFIEAKDDGGGDDNCHKFLNASAWLLLFASLRNVSFPVNCFRRTEVKCVKKLALLYQFDDNVAVVATTVASITTGNVQFQAK